MPTPGFGDAAVDGAMLRHRHAVLNGVPKRYSFSRNPITSNIETLTRGKTLYEEHCTVCHGAHGLGDGELAADLEIKPTDISYIQLTTTSVAGFVYWAIADGGEPIASPMPAFRDEMTSDEIWSVIHFMRNGFRATP